MVIAISLVVVLAILNILTISLIHLARKDALKRRLADEQEQERFNAFMDYERWKETYRCENCGNTDILRPVCPLCDLN